MSRIPGWNAAPALLIVLCAAPAVHARDGAGSPALAASRPGVEGTSGPFVGAAPWWPDSAARRRAGTRSFSFTPRPRERCAVFAILETSGARVAMTTRDKLDEYVFSDGLGLMWNVAPRWALGGGVDLHWAQGGVRLAPTVRCRRWLAREQSVEAALGYFFGDNPSYGFETRIIGPIASVRYAPAPQFFVQAGVCRFRETGFVFDPVSMTSQYPARETTRAFGGIGFAGPPAAALWGGQLVVLAIAVAAFSGMN